MQFFLIFLFTWLIQCGESVPKRSAFQFNATIYDSGNVIYGPHSTGMSYNLYDYSEKLCNWLLSALPSNLTQRSTTVEKLCEATSLSEATNHTKQWAITLHVVTETATGKLIDLNCPTFGELFKYFLNVLVAYFSHSQLKFTVNSYLPKPTAFDPQKAREVEVNVNGYMCDKQFKPIPVKDSAKYNDTFIAEVIKESHYVNLGYPLVKAPEVKITNLMKFPGIDRTFITFKTTLPKMYVQTLGINPDCDLANIEQMILTNVQAEAAFILCGVSTEVLPPPTEKPPTVKPTTPNTTTATETTALASTTKRPMEMLLCAFILSHLLANI